jgi:hypothetical protein
MMWTGLPGLVATVAFYAVLYPVQSSYTLSNVFIWAIPILGFIGTVIGIGQAVGAFSGSLDQAQDISLLKKSLNDVTGGLATAFDTTLHATSYTIDGDTHRRLGDRRDGEVIDSSRL